ncbi:type II secretion system protein, partial [Fangia hongkongensis]
MSKMLTRKVQAGFSFFEVALVAVLISIIMSVALWWFFYFESSATIEDEFARIENVISILQTEYQQDLSSGAQFTIDKKTFSGWLGFGSLVHDYSKNLYSILYNISLTSAGLSLAPLVKIESCIPFSAYIRAQRYYRFGMSYYLTGAKITYARCRQIDKRYGEMVDFVVYAPLSLYYKKNLSTYYPHLNTYQYNIPSYSNLSYKLSTPYKDGSIFHADQLGLGTFNQTIKQLSSSFYQLESCGSTQTEIFNMAVSGLMLYHPMDDVPYNNAQNYYHWLNQPVKTKKLYGPASYYAEYGYQVRPFVIHESPAHMSPFDPMSPYKDPYAALTTSNKPDIKPLDYQYYSSAALFSVPVNLTSMKGGSGPYTIQMIHFSQCADNNTTFQPFTSASAQTYMSNAPTDTTVQSDAGMPSSYGGIDPRMPTNTYILSNIGGYDLANSNCQSDNYTCEGQIYHSALFNYTIPFSENEAKDYPNRWPHLLDQNAAIFIYQGLHVPYELNAHFQSPPDGAPWSQE